LGVVAHIVLRPRFYEIGIFQEQYDALTGDLKDAGHTVGIEREVEARSAGEIARTAYDVAIHVLDSADEEIIAAIVGYLIARLRGKAELGANRGSRRRAFIYGPRGELLREVELEDD
jgi:hypothetical protein